MAKKGPPADVDKASNTESERNIQQGSNRGRLWEFFIIILIMVFYLFTYQVLENEMIELQGCILAFFYW